MQFEAMNDTLPPPSQPPNTETFNYDIPLQTLGLLWAKGLKYPNGEPIKLTDCTTYVDLSAGIVFIKVTNVKPTIEQLTPKQ